MAVHGKFFKLCSIVGNYRNFLLTRNCFPTYQPCATLKQALEERLGLPAKPKKPLIPYFRFMYEQRPNLAKKHPGMKLIEMTKLIAKDWQQVDPVTRERYENEFKKEQVEYTNARLKYEQTISPEQRELVKAARLMMQENKEKRKLRKKIKDLGKPKKPSSAFLLFCNEKLTTRVDSNYKVWQKMVAEEWNNMNESDKEKYLIKANNAMGVYKKQMQIWDEKMIRLGHIDVVRDEALIEPKSKTKNNPL